MNKNKKLFSACLAVSLSLLSKTLAAKEYINTLPPPETIPSGYIPEYRATLYLNGIKLQNRIPLKIINSDIFINKAFASTLYLPKIFLAQDNQDDINLSKINQISASYSTEKHALVINVPPDWLPEQKIELNQNSSPVNYSRTCGLAIDYDAYVSRNRVLDTGSLYLGARLFTGSGYLFSSGVANHYALRNAYYNDNSWTRYLSYYRQYFADNNTQLILGDLIASGSTWDSSVRMGGISFQKDFQLTPDKNIYQSPSIRGTAKAPSIVDIFMDNRKISSEPVSSGPYQINNIPFINGAGQVTVVTTDRLGNKTNQTIPLYKSTTLLAAGLTQFSANLGYLRYDYGYRDSYYRNPAFSGFLTHGVTQSLTDAFFMQSAQHLQMAGAGIRFLAAQYGVISLTGAVSSDNEASRQNGAKGDISYTYATRRLNLSYDHTSYSRGYADLSDYGYNSCNINRNSLQSVDQLWLSYQPVSNYTLGFGYFFIRPYHHSNWSMQNVSLAVPTPLSGQLSLSLSAYNASGHDVMTMLDWSLPLSDSAQARFTNTHAHSGSRNDVQLSWGGYGPQQTHADIALSRDENAQNYQRMAIYHGTQYANLNGGVYGYHDKTWWLQGSGTATWIDHAVQFNPQSQGAFVLVKTGVPGVPYYYGGSLKGYTNSRGYGFINGIQPGMPAEIAIDPTRLAAQYHSDRYRSKIRVYPQSGAEVNFSVRTSFPAQFRLLDNHFQPLPAGSVIKDEQNSSNAFVGYNGIGFLYLTDDKPTLLTVYRKAGEQCKVIIARKDFTSANVAQPTYICR
ncbi:hypothetical protein BL250_15160 [Erwinia sp. OLTSP20]|uniref:fimbria/pilus outer membrane usher protein n=1 Tax=unclassified Erwinia TaxID=2622719 RepID=UPI000C1A053C|nr:MULTISPECIES: fimbria/pilus outer membrane usher protein [unclassified Erwinia]PIJ48478.1 hypothetical protein BV501_16935 [Erwinia sp. OAMSP11]PIJ75974.1 hypothetical protein BK416_00340 [Erwinia sp. OLSSP12]PIJ78874.1 hypothetical protein BLD47_16285 [Erwinia sp. OLCASP19]PIJ87436.1 hypothetical protein BLD46_00370 [Erwinia sp. OLMTSP26]PIJ88986.1 hypothetical protein BLD49_00370 [Erwinia sp. OLMDSP33]